MKKWLIAFACVTCAMLSIAAYNNPEVLVSRYLSVGIAQQIAKAGIVNDKTTQNTLLLRQVASQTADDLVIQTSAGTTTAYLSLGKGLLLPQFTYAQRAALTPAAGECIIYKGTTKKLNCYDGASWQFAW